MQIIVPKTIDKVFRKDFIGACNVLTKKSQSDIQNEWMHGCMDVWLQYSHQSYIIFNQILIQFMIISITLS